MGARSRRSLQRKRSRRGLTVEPPQGFGIEATGLNFPVAIPRRPSGPTEILGPNPDASGKLFKEAMMRPRSASVSPLNASAAMTIHSPLTNRFMARSPQVTPIIPREHCTAFSHSLGQFRSLENATESGFRVNYS